MKRKNKKTLNQENPLTEEELSMLKNAVDSEEIDRSTLPHYDNSDKAKFFRFLKKDKLFAVVCVLLCVLVVALLTMCIVIAANIASKKPNTDDFTFILGEEKYTAEYKDVMRDGAVYIDMYRVAQFAGLTKTGTSADVKFTSDENNYLRFENASNMAVINGCLVEMGGTARVNKTVCEIPLTFLQKAVGGESTSGLKISLDSNTNTVKIVRRVHPTDKKDVYTPVKIEFHSDSFNVLQSIQRPSEEQQNYEYVINIDSLMSCIDPENAQEYLILVNKQNPLGDSYAPTDLEYISGDTNRKEIQLRHDAEIAVTAMIREMSTVLYKQQRLDDPDYKDVFVTSAYRPYSYQVSLFNRYVNEHMTNDGMTREEAEAAALEYSARPGTSEHQSGLCVDITNRSDMSGKLEENFEQTEEFKWLCENAHKFGFILRYPKGKEDVTGYTYEPWHYRFVGRTAAAEIYNSGLCLEEYLELN